MGKEVPLLNNLAQGPPGGLDALWFPSSHCQALGGRAPSTPLKGTRTDPT